MKLIPHSVVTIVDYTRGTPATCWGVGVYVYRAFHVSIHSWGHAYLMA